MTKGQEPLPSGPAEAWRSLAEASARNGEAGPEVNVNVDSALSLPETEASARVAGRLAIEKGRLETAVQATLPGMEPGPRVEPQRSEQPVNPHRSAGAGERVRTDHDFSVPGRHRRKLSLGGRYLVVDSPKDADPEAKRAADAEAVARLEAGEGDRVPRGRARRRSDTPRRPARW